MCSARSDLMCLCDVARTAMLGPDRELRSVPGACTGGTLSLSTGAQEQPDGEDNTTRALGATGQDALVAGVSESLSINRLPQRPQQRASARVSMQSRPLLALRSCFCPADGPTLPGVLDTCGVRDAYQVERGRP